VSSLDRAFDLLRAFSFDRRVMTLSELARASAQPKSTTHRLVARLVQLELLERHNGEYQLGLTLTTFGATTPVAEMRDRAAPYLAALHTWSGGTIHFATMRGFDVVYLEKFSGRQPACALTRVGAKVPASCTALGKAMLSWENLNDLADVLPSPLPTMTPSSVSNAEALVDQLREAKRTGIAHEQGESVEGLHSIATPVVINGRAPTAISATFGADETMPVGMRAALTDAAAHLAREVSLVLADGRQRSFPGEYQADQNPFARPADAAFSWRTEVSARDRSFRSTGTGPLPLRASR
jgi:DNA-binding IclR family transcriptional regulator